MATTTHIKFGDGLTVVDEGAGIIRVDAGAASVATLQWSDVGLTSRDAPRTPSASAVAILAASRLLLGYWRLGEPTGVSWADTSGHPAGPANAAVQGSGTGVQPHVVGGLPAADDDGAVGIHEGQFIQAPEPATPRRFNLEGASQKMTVGAWVRPLATTRTINAALVGEWADAGFGYCGWALLLAQTPAGHQVSFARREMGTPAQSVTTGPVSLVQGIWRFVVGTHDGAGHHKLYVNGAQVATAFNNSIVTNPTFNTGVQIGFGGTASSGIATVSAEVDEVTVWGDELSPGEIAMLASMSGIS